MFNMQSEQTLSFWNPDTVASAAVFDGGHLERIPTVTGDRSRFTIAFWLQLTQLETFMRLFSCAGAGGATENQLSGWIDASGLLGSGQTYWIHTVNRTMRDAQWFHVIWSYDMNEAAKGDKLHLYINGERVTDVTLRADWNWFAPTAWNRANYAHRIGISMSNTAPFLGNMAQFVHLDGHSLQNGDLTIADLLDLFIFGTNGQQYVPKPDKEIEALALAAGGNSFALTDQISTGQDGSGLGNHWTVVGRVFETGNIPSNPHAIMNPLDKDTTHSVDMGGARVTTTNMPTTRQFKLTHGSQPVGRASYFEVFLEQISNRVAVGLSDPTRVPVDGNNGLGYNVTPGIYGIGESGGTFVTDGLGGSRALSESLAQGDIIGVAHRQDLQAIWFSINGIWVEGGNPASGANPTLTYTTDMVLLPHVASFSWANNEIYQVRFTEDDWTYPPPTGFKAINSVNLPTPEAQGADVFAVNVYSGNSALRSFDMGIPVDFHWGKDRSEASDNHVLLDSMRGGQYWLESNTTNAEQGPVPVFITSFDKFGYTLGGHSDSLNRTGDGYVSWNWAAGGPAVVNNDGSIESQVSAHPAGHFGIVRYNGTNSDATLGHGLGGAVDLAIFKCLNANLHWPVWGRAFSVLNGGHMYLSLPGPVTGAVGGEFWTNDANIGSTLNLKNEQHVNSLGFRYIAYLFKSVPGLLKIGTYKGTGGLGHFVHLGFKARYILFKATNLTRDWIIVDTERDPVNTGQSNVLYASSPTAEGLVGGVDIYSNGFRQMSTNSTMNNNGTTYLYMAIADIAGGGNLPPIYGR